MSTPDTPIVERLCRSLAFHVIETEGALEFMDPMPPDIVSEADHARALIAEAGFKIDVLYPPEDRPTLQPAD